MMRIGPACEVGLVAELSSDCSSCCAARRGEPSESTDDPAILPGREGATEELIDGDGWLCGCLMRLMGGIAEAGTVVGGTSELIRTEGLQTLSL